MSGASFTESVVEGAALAWLEGLGYAIKHGPARSPSGDTLTLALSQWERDFWRRYPQRRFQDAAGKSFGVWQHHMQEMQQFSWAIAAGKRSASRQCD